MNIRELAEQAGIGSPDLWKLTVNHMAVSQLEKFAELVAANEREECAKIVDHILKEGGGTYGDAIRARCKA